MGGLTDISSYKVASLTMKNKIVGYLSCKKYFQKALKNHQVKNGRTDFLVIS